MAKRALHPMGPCSSPSSTASLTNPTMAIMRTRIRLTSPAPPPSPIPTAKGSRSAAVNDHVLSEYLNKTLQIPDLNLPKSYFPASLHHPVEIDYRSIVSRERDSIDQLLRSSVEFGVFRIVGHGILADEVGSILPEVEWVFRNSDLEQTKLTRNVNREELVLLRFREQDVIGTEKHRKFSCRMESVRCKLDVIAHELGQVFSENAAKKFGKKIEKESVLCLYRYKHDNLVDENLPSTKAKDSEGSRNHALNLHLPIQQCEFCVQSGKGTLFFDTEPEAIVVTVGKLLQEWSLEEFKSVSAGLVFEPDLHGSNATFSIELKCSPLTLNYGIEQIKKTITIADQIFITVCLTLLYKFIVFISS